jgi:hypothetical protein
MPADAATTGESADTIVQDDGVRPAVQQIMVAIHARLEGMVDVPAAMSAAAHRWVKEQCADTRLPHDFKQRALTIARSLDCEAHMRAAGEAVAEAARLALPDRAVKLAEARAFYGQACHLGAHDQFRRATGRLIDAIEASALSEA